MAQRLKLRVFLMDFDDIACRDRYPRHFYQQLFFGDRPPEASPEGHPMGDTVANYFHALSGGDLKLVGEVVDWRQAEGFQIRRIPHYNPRAMDADSSIAATNEGILGALLMRTFGTTDGFPTDPMIMTSPEWSGERADRCVLLYAGYAWGGCKREWGSLHASFRDLCGKAYYQKHYKALTQLDWEDAWDRQPAVALIPAFFWVGNPGMNPDGTMVSDLLPSPGDLSMVALSLIVHEVGHLVANFDDMYGACFAPWGAYDNMDNPASPTHFPMGVSSWLRRKSGWMSFDRAPLEPQPGLVLEPLDSHRVAYEFPCGPLEHSESIVVENRTARRYHDLVAPPDDLGQGLLFYRNDPRASRALRFNDKNARRLTTLIYPCMGGRELWMAGSSLTGGLLSPLPAPASQSLAHHPFAFTSRNSLQELWWQFHVRGSAQDDPSASAQALRLDAECMAHNLLDGATLRDLGRKGPRRPGSWRILADLPPEPTFTPREGPLTFEVEGSQHFTLNLGRLTGQNLRFYGLFRMEKGDIKPQPLAVSLRHGDRAVSIQCTQVDEDRLLTMDLMDFRGDLELRVDNASDWGRAFGRLSQAWLVPLPTLAQDLLAAGSGLTWNWIPSSPGAAPQSLVPARHDSVTLAEGATVGPEILALSPPSEGVGQIQGVSPVLTIPDRAVLSLRIALPWEHPPMVDAAHLTLRFRSLDGSEVGILEAFPLTMFDRNHAYYGCDVWHFNTSLVVEAYLQSIAGRRGTFHFTQVHPAGRTGQPVLWCSARMYVLPG